MKKTININLNSSALVIDEDAYVKLESYLDDVRSRLDSEDAEEVMRDVEARVGELFSERLGRYRNVVDIEDVKAVTEKLGSPEDFGETKSKATAQEAEPQAEKHSRNGKVYRDGDDKVVAGVCSGLAQKFGWSVTGVRLLTILLFCMSCGFMIVLYAVLWVIVPEAKTVAQKLEMQGIEPSLQNISDYSRNHPQTESSRKGRGLIASMFYLMGVLFVVMLLAIVIFTVVVTIVLLFGLSFEAFGATFSWGEFGSLKYVLALIVSVLVIVTIAVVYIAKLIRRRNSEDKKQINSAWVIAWMVIALAAMLTAAYSAMQIKRHGEPMIEKLLEIDDDDWFDDTTAFVTETRCQGDSFNCINASVLDVYMVRDTAYYVEVEAPEKMMGKIETTVDPLGALNIKTTAKRGGVKSRVTVHYMGDLRMIGLSAGAEMHADTLKGRELRIDLSSAADLEARAVKADMLSIDASSGSDAEIDYVETESLSADASSGADIDITYCKSMTTNLDASSGADIEIRGDLGRLTKNQSSGGEIEIR